MNPIQQGLYVSAVGLVVLFATSSIFYLVLVGLQKLFPYKEEEVESEVQAVTAPAMKQSDEKAVVAAIAAALSMAQSSQTIPGLGESLQNTHGAWWSAKVMAAHKNTTFKRK